MRLECGAGTARTDTHEALLHIPTLRRGDERRRCGGRALHEFCGARASERLVEDESDSRVAIPRVTGSSRAAMCGLLELHVR